MNSLRQQLGKRFRLTKDDAFVVGLMNENDELRRALLPAAIAIYAMEEFIRLRLTGMEVHDLGLLKSHRLDEFEEQARKFWQTAKLRDAARGKIDY